MMLLTNKFKIIVSAVFCALLANISPAYALDANSNAKDVADKLNELYSRTLPCANDEPAYYCSGIVIHGQVVPVKDENENLLPSWYLPAYRSVGSFSYLRADITPHTGEPIWVNTGFILTPLDEVQSVREYNYKVFCAYPGDGGSFGDAEESCHFSVEELPGVTVESTDIKTVDDYIRKFFSNAGAGAWSFSLLGFQADKDGFDLAMQLHKYVYKDHFQKASHSICVGNRCRDHNELIISAWDKDKISAEQVPVIAFFAIINDDQNPFFEGTGRTSTSNEEMEQLFKDADDYSKAAHFARSIPVVTIDMAKLRSGASDVFAQAVRPQ